MHDQSSIYFKGPRHAWKEKTGGELGEHIQVIKRMNSDRSWMGCDIHLLRTLTHTDNNRECQVPLLEKNSTHSHLEPHPDDSYLLRAQPSSTESGRWAGNEPHQARQKLTTVNGNGTLLPRIGWELGLRMFIWEYCLARSTCLGTLPRNARRAETAKRSVADRSWKELAAMWVTPASQWRRSGIRSPYKLVAVTAGAITEPAAPYLL
eukprot:superscaffoldBa00001112_g9035